MVQPKQTIPHIPKDIMDYLLSLYPDRSPDSSMSDRDIWVRHGEIKVARHFKSLFDRQEDNVMGQLDADTGETSNVLRRR